MYYSIIILIIEGITTLLSPYIGMEDKLNTYGKDSKTR